ncbi:MAG: hypothetical protein WCG10_01570 [Chlamydiota bacterium]
MREALEEIPSLAAANFLQMVVEVHQNAGPLPWKKPFLLPDTSLLLDEEKFADLAMSYSLSGFHIGIRVNQAFQDVAFPDVENGDSVEFFFDTRDRKSAGTIHKFCHHFIFLPKEVGGIQACEMTKFRLEDAHPLCDSKLLQVEAIFKNKEYELKIFIDKEALYGFDPEQFNRLGFTYRVNRKGGPSQHFNLGSQEYLIEKYPSVWASLKLKT